jgi:hypothetical protein
LGSEPPDEFGFAASAVGDGKPNTQAVRIRGYQFVSVQGEKQFGYDQGRSLVPIHEGVPVRYAEGVSAAKS